eukprot:7090204-Pyramimonas_sp.AAC.1
MQEIDGQAGEDADMEEPLRWCMHGGPGTGKSHVLSVIRQELFEGLLKWTIVPGAVRRSRWRWGGEQW